MFFLSSFSIEFGVLPFILLHLPLGCKMAAATPVIMFTFKNEEGAKFSTFMRKMQGFPAVPNRLLFISYWLAIVSRACQVYSAYPASEEEYYGRGGWIIAATHRSAASIHCSCCYCSAISENGPVHRTWHEVV